MKHNIIVFSILTLFLLGACGQKGDLYRSADAPPPGIEQNSQ